MEKAVEKAVEQAVEKAVKKTENLAKEKAKIEKLEIAKNLKLSGIYHKTISNATGLSIEEIEKLQPV